MQESFIIKFISSRPRSRSARPSRTSESSAMVWANRLFSAFLQCNLHWSHTLFMQCLNSWPELNCRPYDSIWWSKWPPNNECFEVLKRSYANEISACWWCSAPDTNFNHLVANICLEHKLLDRLAKIPQCVFQGSLQTSRRLFLHVTLNLSIFLKGSYKHP